ncbi:excinuclease ABC subunit UvrA [Microbacterium lacticum]|uniref:UvrABC system protein A n=1 Tax=Microbacterium lacticum TaxID=33885 RepID=A0A4Y3UNS4_9MICO|nr:excinuclease ABC subunit UvrA [Microbacterium lacticum]TQM90231.1 excinuclease ABC subunit A [Microbacterium lacticum]GEB95169.1 hypothetical protein MLA01_13880 [Microbacterium lacticum]GGN21965.1 hypothetical protein GCM10009724_15270 [Microbacterium lacticum]
MTSDVTPITLRGVRHHNLDIESVQIAPRSLTVFTGVSGSGKSTLAFDTIYAYGYLQYLESLSAFARRSLPKLAAPQVDWVSGLSPTVAIEQKTVTRNPRSSVGSLTEISDRIRLLLSRAGEHSCPSCGTEVHPLGLQEHLDWWAAADLGPVPLRAHDPEGAQLGGSALPDDARMPEPMVREVLREQLRAGRVVTVRRGEAVVRHVGDGWTCTGCGRELEETSASFFTSNSPDGMCSTCQGLGTVVVATTESMVADPGLSVLDGALAFFGDRRRSKKTWWPLRGIPAFLASAGYSVETPWLHLPPAVRETLLFGRTEERLPAGADSSLVAEGGLAANLERLHAEGDASGMSEFYAAFLVTKTCPTCQGSRLNERAFSVRLAGLTIAEITALPISELPAWLDAVEHDLDAPLLREIGRELVPQLRDRFRFLLDVGLHYLTLARPAPSLSAGEGQRVRLARQLSTGLTGVTYVLDEPSIGLHAIDIGRLIESFRALVRRGNTVLVVEHDRATLDAADELIELGPGAGTRGGRIVARGSAAELGANPDSLTGAYLDGRRRVGLPGRPRPAAEEWLELSGATMHNLREVSARFPLQRLTCVTGVSGSGKSSLILGSLRPAMEAMLRSEPLPSNLSGLSGWRNVQRVLTVTQDTLVGSNRSTPATFIGVFDEFRRRFAAAARTEGRRLGVGDFSFNTQGVGRCDRCGGKGMLKIEMLFMADAVVPCPECGGRRYSSEVLDVRIGGHSIADVLAAEPAVLLQTFGQNERIARPLRMLIEVGLGYLTLGQDTATLSGGESQRLKLARELLKARAGRVLYLIDEPTTGLHFQDIQLLLEVLDRLVDRGDTVVVIEHDAEFVAAADWVVDLGPDGGAGGGLICDAGTPDEIASRDAAKIAPYLRELRDRSRHAR